MKICLLEPHPRIAGAVTYQLHLREGMRLAGHEAYLCAMTRSGAPKISWGSSTPRRGADDKVRNGYWPSDVDGVIRCKTPEMAASQLDQFDLIVMTEPKCPPQDRDALKDVSIPDYVRALEKTKTPWTAVLHDHTYGFKTAPFMPHLLRTESFSGTLIQRGPDYLEIAAREFFGRLPVDRVKKLAVIANLPYAPKHAIDAPLPAGLGARMTARVVSNKGQQALCRVASEIGCDVVIWGGASQAQNACATFLLWEELTKGLKWESVLDPEGVINIRPWKVRTPSGSVVEYRGPFGPDDDPYDGEAHASLTSVNFARGRPEYVELEAMDRGCVPVILDNHDPSGEYSACRLTEYREVRDHDQTELIERVREAIRIARSAERLGVTHSNRVALRRKECPKEYAERLLKEVLS